MYNDPFFNLTVDFKSEPFVLAYFLFCIYLMIVQGLACLPLGKKGRKVKRRKVQRKKKEPPPPPPVGPWIQKLHLLNNGIDAHGPGSNLGPVMCMKMFRK